MEGLPRAATPRARTTSAPLVGRETEVGILLDTETSGLDHRKDELIELGMVKFDYAADDRILGVRDTFSALTSRRCRSRPT
jgi:DNA polymerase III subunit epsilon